MDNTMAYWESKLKAGAEEFGTPRIIRELIDEHSTKHMDDGVNYYYNDNDIRNRQLYYWVDGQKKVDETKINRRISHGWHKLLVDQKVSYLTGEPITFSAENEEFSEVINDYLGDEWDDTLPELCKGASNKGVEWLHPYIDEVEEGKGGFEYVLIDAREVIPIWETRRQKKLQYLIRYYWMTVNGKERIRAEFWTPDNVTYYMQQDNGVFELDDTEPVNPASHFYVNGVGYGWGRVPFIPFRNNEEMVSDLQFYKSLIDEYDLNVSDFANNLAEIQDVVWVLKNYQGESLKEFQENLRYYKALKTDGDGGADKIEVNIPTEARKEHTDRLEENIFLFGQGVNVKTDRFGNSPSGIALKFLYALLDMKASVLERKFRKSIRELLWFLGEYIRIAENQVYDFNEVQVTFNKSMILNELELVQMAQASKGIVSDRTIIANHPWSEDPDLELEMLEEQQPDIDLDAGLGEEEGGDDDE